MLMVGTFVFDPWVFVAACDPDIRTTNLAGANNIAKELLGTIEIALVFQVNDSAFPEPDSEIHIETA